MKAKTYPSREYLLEVFDYNSETGVFNRKTRPLNHFVSTWAMNAWNGRYAGTIVDHKSVAGYIESKVDYKILKMHRVAWILTYNEEPVFIDHINGIRDDNRIVNLRSVTKKQNGSNRGISSNNTTGHRGVSFHSRDLVWASQITHNSVRIHLGSFENFDLACAARKNAEVKYYEEYRRKV